ncbi:MAG TPA: dephospho-CoA kinase [Pyrinomonadaceae bacterium]|nr:dephospho-CoA kinase [Pyrinomonadaceae bacterium]
MLKVGLTGSIAVGKSFVTECFRALGCRILDADKTARDVVEPGTPGLHRIVKEFGAGVLTDDGRLDRGKLGSIVFADDAKRRLLNSIVHPFVIEAQDAWLQAVEIEEPDAIVIVDAALMIESGGYKRFDKLIVVWCEPALQFERLMGRDPLSHEEANKRIDAQMPQEEKKGYADYLIDTSGGFEDVRKQVAEIMEELRVFNTQAC